MNSAHQDGERRLPPCEDCGGPQVANLRLLSHYHVGLHPVGRTMWSRPLSSLYAAVCLSCGRVKFFAAELDKLRQEAQQHPERFMW